MEQKEPSFAEKEVYLLVNSTGGNLSSAYSIFNAQDTLNEIFQTQKPEELPYPYRHQVEFLDPILMEEWGGIQEEGQYYLKEILQKSGYDKDVDRLVRTLMFEFPTHGFVIHYDHALKLGLKVTKYTEDMKAWNFMRLWLSKYITQQTDRHFIRYVLPKKHEIVNKIEKNS